MICVENVVVENKNFLLLIIMGWESRHTLICPVDTILYPANLCEVYTYALLAKISTHMYDNLSFSIS